MNRKDILREYDALRASIDRMTDRFNGAYTDTERNEAAQKIALSHWREALEADGDVAALVNDFALYEPDESGHCALSRCVRAAFRELSEEDRRTCRLMVNSDFSVFQTIGLHEVAGVYIKDTLRNRPPMWMVDRRKEAALRARPYTVEIPFAIRYTDNGRFCANIFTIPEFGKRFPDNFRNLISGIKIHRRDIVHVAYQIHAAFLMPEMRPEFFAQVRKTKPNGSP